MQVKIEGTEAKLVFQGGERDAAADLVRNFFEGWGHDDPLAAEIEAVVLAVPEHGEVEWTVPAANMEDVRTVLEAGGFTEQAQALDEFMERVG